MWPVASTAEVIPEEWRLVLAARPNVLIEGSDAATDAVVRALTPRRAAPIIQWDDGRSREATVPRIVREV